MNKNVWLPLTLFLLSFAVTNRAKAEESPAGSAESACAALAGTDFSTVLDAPTQVTAARFIKSESGGVSRCEVRGYVASHVGFELALPGGAWNGKFLHVGCGGFCGGISLKVCDPILARGYACIATDLGHRSSVVDGKWAYNDLEAKVDFAYRATHVATLAGKAITEHYFGRVPAHSYFLGCSTGGRQGMVEAQRFPWDFDGIVAGAPIINETGDAMALLWNVAATLGPDGRPILTADDAKLVHAAAVAQCGQNDHVNDGLIADPRQCKFDPAKLVCREGRTSGCLSEAQALAVKKIYAGPTNSRGEALYTGGALPGSELNWIGDYLSRDGAKPVYAGFMSDFFGYMAFVPDPGPGWKPSDFNWDRDTQRFGMMESLYSGSNPDLRKFKAAGGKLIVYQGWADQSVLPLNVIDYYETAEKTLGGRAATEEFLRLFMIPGMNHCYGGEGAHSVDYLSYLEAWVERSVAPDMLRSVHPRSDAGQGIWWGVAPPAPADVAFSRPVYPYPRVPRYGGKGDSTDAASYVPAEPRASR